MKLLLEYNENNSVIHKLDPRVKCLWLMGNMLILLFFQDIKLLFLSFFLVLLTTRLAGISLNVYTPMSKVMLMIGLQFIIFQGIFRPEGMVLLQIGILKLYLGGMVAGMVGILRLITLAFLFLQFLMCTSPEELTLLFVKLGLPHKYTVLVGMTLYFLPVVERDLRAIYDSQQARGLELKTVFQKLKGLLPVMLPLILRSLKRTQEVALSMELKGYTRYSTRTFLRSISFSTVDIKVFGILVIYFMCKITYQVL